MTHKFCKAPRMADLPKFQQQQYAFTAHIRQPGQVAKPEGIEDRRMGIYRDLLFNNIYNFISNGFPVLHSLYREEAWLKLVRGFFSQHNSHSPYFSAIPKEFLDYLQNEFKPDPEDPPFLLELAHYEWVELALMLLDEQPNWQQIERNGDLLESPPVLSPLAWPLAYQWPVQNISPDFRPEAPLDQPSYLIVYRNAEDAVGFIEANPVTMRLVQLIQENTDKPGKRLLNQLVDELQHPNPTTVLEGGHQTLLRLHNLDIISGTRR